MDCRKAVVFLGAGLLPTATTAARAQQRPAPAPTLVFDSVTVVDVESGKLVADQRVVITGTRIQAVGRPSAISLPADAQVVPAKGKYLIPGLWDLHTHPKREAPRAYELFLANGVTGIRNIGSDVPLDTSRLWRQEILAGQRIGPPRQLLGGPNIEPGSGRDQLPILDPARAPHVVDSLKAARADLLKFRSVSREVWFALARAARRARMPFGGHLEHESAWEAVDSGTTIIDHIEFLTHWMSGRDASQYDKYLPDCLGPAAKLDECRALADHLRQHNAWVVPTVIVSAANYASTNLSQAVHIIKESIDQSLPTFFTTLALGTDSVPAYNWLQGTVHPDSLSGGMHVLQRVGMPLMSGTDVGAGGLSIDIAGFSLHAELAMYVAEGLTPLTALQTATLNPAKMWHATDSLGTVAPGKLADLVLLEGNPLEDITNVTTIRAVVANGRYFDRTALNRVLRESQVDASAPAAPGP